MPPLHSQPSQADGKSTAMERGLFLCLTTTRKRLNERGRWTCSPTCKPANRKNLSMCPAMSTAPRPMTACGFPTASGAGSPVESADTAPWTISLRSMAIRLWTRWKLSSAGRQSGRLLLCLRLKRKSPNICFYRRPRPITGLWWTTSKKEGSTRR